MRPGERTRNEDARSARLQRGLFTTLGLEKYVLADHPLRPIRNWVDDTLTQMDASSSAMYEADIKGGRRIIVPQKLMRAMLLQVFYSVRSVRQLVSDSVNIED